MNAALRAVPVLFLVLLAAACAAGSSTASASGSNVLDAEDLEPVANLSVYDAIQRLRPRWLRGRTASEPPVVMMNGTRMGGVEVLRNLQASDMTSIRFRNGRDATTRYGTGYGGGTIELSTRGP